jgi:ketopantoate reductase
VGFKVEVSINIVDFQTTHAVGMSLIGRLVMKHGGDVRALTHSKEDLMLFIDTRREAHQILHVMGYKIIPRFEAVSGVIPGFV